MQDYDPLHPFRWSASINRNRIPAMWAINHRHLSNMVIRIFHHTYRKPTHTINIVKVRREISIPSETTQII